jgi:hypothetical protein
VTMSIESLEAISFRLSSWEIESIVVKNADLKRSQNFV